MICVYLENDENVENRESWIILTSPGSYAGRITVACRDYEKNKDIQLSWNHEIMKSWILDLVKTYALVFCRDYNLVGGDSFRFLAPSGVALSLKLLPFLLRLFLFIILLLVRLKRNLKSIIFVGFGFSLRFGEFIGFEEDVFSFCASFSRRWRCLSIMWWTRVVSTLIHEKMRARNKYTSPVITLTEDAVPFGIMLWIRVMSVRVNVETWKVKPRNQYTLFFWFFLKK